MNLRRWLAGALLLAFLAPLLVAGPARKSAGSPASAKVCCGSAACCAGGTGGAGCAEGHCATTKSAGRAPAPLANAMSLVAGCGGSTPMTMVSERDPVDGVSLLATPLDPAPVSAIVLHAAGAPLTALAPADPPPRA